MADDGEGLLLKGVLVSTVTSLVKVRTSSVTDRYLLMERKLQASREASYRLVDLVYPLILECFTPQVRVLPNFPWKRERE